MNTLERAITKAIGNGWEFPSNIDTYQYLDLGAHRFVTQVRTAPNMYDFIYNHDFARALWGEEPYTYITWLPVELYKDTQGKGLKAYNWQYHLQMMVIAPDPIKYLEDNI